MTREEVLEEVGKGRHCSQIVCGAFADETGYDVEETDKVAKFFGGGMMMAQTCGAVTGGLMALGMMGMSQEDAAEYEQKFKERYGSCVCYELLKGKTPAEAKADGSMLELCPEYIRGGIELIQEKLDE